jgi:hypothetical protein
VYFRPPLAIARLGSSDSPLACFEWATEVAIHGAHRTVVEPAVSLDVQSDGSLRPYLPNTIRFRDGGRFRPAAPFFELWAQVVTTDGNLEDRPLNLALLRELGASPANVAYAVTVANRKAERRTQSAACAFIAHLEISATDHDRKPLLACSPHNSGEQPLVRKDRPIPLGHFQVIRPTPGHALGVDLSTLRVRFTPAKGEVYGPPGAIAGPASPVAPGAHLAAQTLRGRIHEIVPEKNRILNPDTPWSSYVMDAQGQIDPQPSDSYDGVNVGDDVSWGVVDDTCDGIIEAQVVIDGVRHVATARVLSSCPDFAPDRRHFYSLIDDLADRDLPPPKIDPDNVEAIEEEVVDLFRRVFETVSLTSLDGTRAHGIGEDLARPWAQNFQGLPKIDQASMTREDVPYVDQIPDLLPAQPIDQVSRAVPHERLPYTLVARAVHAPLTDVDTLLDFLREKREHVRRLIRPPYGRFRELAEDPGPEPNPAFRDTRVLRDIMEDMRMPPYMRDSDETPLSLSWRQYRLLMDFLHYLGTTDAGPRRRRVAQLIERLRQQPGAA